MAKKNKYRKFVSIILVLILAAAAAASGYYIYNVVSDDINGKNQESTEYTLIIDKNDFEYEIGQMLFNNKIVVYDAVWTNWMDKHYPDFEYINGEYYLSADMSYEEIAQKLQNPDISHKSVKVCIPEGYNVFEIADTLEENGVCNAEAFLEVCLSTEGFDYEWLNEIPDNDLAAYKLEGFLFPATYDLAQNSDAHDIADTMLDAFDERLSDDMLQFCEDKNMSLYELITLASVVQEEALGNKSAGNITSVFMNRLEKGAKLQSDVTYFYAAKLRDEHGFSQYVYDAYYTYRCDGLPAGPISNSGQEIINSVINYPETEYMYFFSDLKKQFHFAKDYDTFVKLQEKYPWK